jgi:transposase-like protein
MLVELSVVEQRYHAVMEVISGAPVTEVARRYGVSRQAVHGWLGRYEREGLAGLTDHSHRPACPPPSARRQTPRGGGPITRRRTMTGTTARPWKASSIT